MDKAEYKIATEHIKRLTAQGEYAEALHIADTIDWRRVKSIMMLCSISDLYKVNRRYEDARELLYMAYERNPESRTILYSLCDLCIKLKEFIPAIEYYKAFVEVAPRDTGRYVLQYRLYQAQDVSLEERIEVLEKLKQEDYTEKWGYELAYLYHRIGFATKCVEECDELILLYGKGRYVYKAMELKMLHEPLTPTQQRSYDRRFEYLEQAKDMTRVLPRIDSGDSEMTEEGMVDVTDAPTVEIPQEYLERELQGQVEEIQVKTLDVANAYNTMNLQKELADSLKEILEVSHNESSVDPVYQEQAVQEPGDGAQVYETAAEPKEASAEEAAVEEESVQEAAADISADEAEEALPEEQPEKTPDFDEQISERIKSQTQDIFSAIQAELDRDLLTEKFEEPIEETAEPAEDTAEETIEAEETEQAAPEPIEQPETCEPEEETQPEETPEDVDTSLVENDIYGEFVRVEDTRAQIAQALQHFSMQASVGNIRVTGHDLATCFDFIKVFMGDLKKQGVEFKGKTAKISSVNLNKKEPAEIMSKVQNGILIIERAGRLRKETVARILECLSEADLSMLVFLTDTEQGMNRLTERYPELADIFRLQIDIKDYSGEELIDYAVKYAYQCEYSIETMGLLALRTRIEEMISNDEAPTMEDAKMIVEEAIENANRKSLKHFWDVLLRRRYDEEDMIILREEDFL